MGFKCAVVGCKTGYSSGPRKALFKFPEKDTLRAKWIVFVNRKDFVVTESSRICIDHFERLTFLLVKKELDLIVPSTSFQLYILPLLLKAN